MRRTVLLATSLVFISCGGDPQLAGGDNSGGSSGTSGAYNCTGDPDRGGVVCVPKDSVWTCTQVSNGSTKCTRPGPGTPDGASG